MKQNVVSKNAVKKNAANSAGPKCTFLMGVNDTRMVMVKGFNTSGKLDYDWKGNTEFSGHTRTLPKNKVTLPILWFQNEKLKITKPDIFVNCISDADDQSKSLVKAARYLDAAAKQWPGMPVLNHPRKVLGTRRDLIYQRFHALPGIEIPKTVRFQPKDQADVLETVEKEGFSYPVIVRRCGSHNGLDLALLKSAGDAAALDCLALDGSLHYMIQFKDYKDAEGLYSKTRFIVMGGRIFPRQCITARRWKVNASARDELMYDDAALRQLEEQTLATLEKKISPDALESVRKIYRAVGLDYLGFDVHVKPDGGLLVFEINAAMNSMAKSNYAVFPYLKQYVDAMVKGYNALLAAKIIMTRRDKPGKKASA